MYSKSLNLEDLQDRLLKLEKQNRRFKQLGLAALIVPALMLVMGQAAPSKKIVEANEFVLRDDSGNVRARLATGERHFAGAGVSTPQTLYPEPSLTLYDDKGQMQATLDESSINFFNYQGLPKVSLGDGLGAELLLGESKGSSVAIFSPNSLELSDNNGFSATFGVANLVTPRTGETHKTSAASLTLFDKDKNVIWKAP